MRDKVDGTGKGKILAQMFFDPDLFTQPQGHRFEKLRQTTGGEIEITLQQALEMAERFFVKDNRIDLTDANASGLKTVFNRMRGKCRVVFDSGKALFLGGRNDLAIPKQTSRAIMIVSGDT